jgi:hypothetical protein
VNWLAGRSWETCGRSSAGLKSHACTIHLILRSFKSGGFPMKKNLLLIILVDVIVVAVAVSFCFLYNAKKYEHVQILPLYLTLDLDQAEYHLGQTIVATITFENVSNSPLLFNSRMALDDPTYANRQISFHVTTPSGKPYHVSGYVDYQAMHSDDFITLNPGEIITHTYKLNEEVGHYKFTELGVYHFTVDYLNIFDPIYINPSDNRMAWKGMVFSNEVVFTIIP